MMWIREFLKEFLQLWDNRTNVADNLIEISSGVRCLTSNKPFDVGAALDHHLHQQRFSGIFTNIV